MATPKVAGWDEFGAFNEKTLTNLKDDGMLFWRIFHGPDVGLAPGDVDLQLIESVATEFRTAWAGLGGSILQAYISTSSGEALDKAVEVLRMTRILAIAATVTLTFSRLTAAPAGGITIPSGSLVSTKDGIEFSTSATATILEGQTSVSAAASAVVAGSDGNVASATITTIISTLSGVDSVSNSSPASGGSDRESDDALKARALSAPANRGKATPNAIKAQVADLGVQSVTILINNEDDVSADDLFIDLTASSVDSETISTGGTYNRLAQKFVVPSGGKWVQDLRIKGKHGASAPTVTIRFETDNAGEPSGTLAHANAEKTGVAPGNNVDTNVHYTAGFFLAAASYWVVIITTAGEYIWTGTTTGTADQVKRYDGAAWSLSAIDNASVTVKGGIPGHSVEGVIQGGVTAEITQRLFDVVGGGIRTWGAVSASVTDDSGNPQTVRYSTPTVVTIFVAVTILKDSDFDVTNGPDAIRDAIVKVLGGTDTKGSLQPGLGLGEDVFRADLIQAIKGVTGVDNITNLVFDVSDGGTNEADIAIAPRSLARAETVANIGVTVV